MNEKNLAEKPDRAKRIRNIIAGSVVWTIAVVFVVFVVLDPSESVEMQIGAELSGQEPVTVPTDSSTDPKIEIVDVDTSNVAIESDTDSDFQAFAQPESKEAKQQTSSIVYENESTEVMGTTDSSESIQTASIPDSTESNVAVSSEIRTPTENDAGAPTGTEDVASTQVSPTTRPSELGLFIQVAAFSKVENAQIKREEISKALFPVRVVEGENGMNLVLVGPYLTEAEAKKVQTELNSKFQLDGSFLKYTEIETTKVAMTDNTSGVATQSVSAATTSSSEESAIVDGWYVRVGSYKNLGNAKTSRLRVEKLNMSTVVTREKELNVLMVGPFQDENTAQTAKGRISRELNIKDAFLVRVGS